MNLEFIPFLYDNVRYNLHIQRFDELKIFYFLNPITHICEKIKPYHKDEVPDELREADDLYKHKYYSKL